MKKNKTAFTTPYGSWTITHTGEIISIKKVKTIIVTGFLKENEPLTDEMFITNKDKWLELEKLVPPDKLLKKKNEGNR